MTEIAPKMQILDKNLKTIPIERFEELEQQGYKGIWIMQVLEKLSQATMEAYAKVPSQP